MKIIGLLIVKNESWILPTTIPQQLKFVDQILVLDGNSTDDTLKILKKFGKQILIKSQGNNPDNYAAWRQELLEWARERKATHIVSLDADEAFSSNLLQSWKQILSKMKPGEKLFLEWISLWKNPYQYVTAGNVFSNLKKDFVFCDDKTSPYARIALHEGRTPGATTKENSTYIPKTTGVVLHYQFVPWLRLQMKQAFMRCRELTLKTDTAKGINYKYEETLDKKELKIEQIPKSWTAGMKISKGLENTSHDWFYKGILDYFNENGINYYEPLQIWHIQKLREKFINETKRQPKESVYNKPTRLIRKCVGKCLSLLPNKLMATLFSAIKKITRVVGL